MKQYEDLHGIRNDIQKVLKLLHTTIQVFEINDGEEEEEFDESEMYKNF